MKHRIALAIMTILLALVAACGNGEEPTTTPTGIGEPGAGGDSGHNLFISKGCAACHGRDAEGTVIAPSLPGHNAEQIRRQVRNPIGSMPRFDLVQVTDTELEQIVAYIVGLTPGGDHFEVVIGDVMVMHHWMALSAIEADHVEDAVHHVEHIIGLIQDDDTHLNAMEGVQAALLAGDLHDAEHDIEGMLAGTAQPGLGQAQVHLTLALSALGARDATDAVHHLDHFMTLAEAAEAAEAQEALDLISEGDIHDAEHLVETLLGKEHENGHEEAE